MDVIKRNGQKQQFSEQKMRKSIESAVQDAGYNVQDKRNLIDKTVQDVTQTIGNVDQVESKQIRNIIIDDLGQEEQAGGDTDVAAAWRNYELEHGIEYEERPGHSHELDSFKRKK